MDVAMGLPSPKTPSMKRIFQMESPRIIQLPHTPRSEGFRNRKKTQDIVDPSPVSNSVWNSDTPPMSNPSVSAPSPSKETRDPATSTKDLIKTISVNQFYSRSANKRCLLPLFKTAADISASIGTKQEPKMNSLKRKRSKSLDHRKKYEPDKLNKNICHKIKRPKRKTSQKPPNLPLVVKPDASDNLRPTSAAEDYEKMEISFQSNSSATNVRPKLPEKKISVNVNRMVRVNVQGGELRFTKHIRSPRKFPKSKSENMDEDNPGLCENWLHEKVDSIIVNLDKENHSSDASSIMNESGSNPPSSDTTANLSDAFCELGVSELRTGPPALAGFFTERANQATTAKKQTENPEVLTNAVMPLSPKEDPPMDDSSDKLFPVFYKTHQVKYSVSPKKATASSHSKFSLPPKSTDGLEQLIIDAGQKSLGQSNCPECGFYYQAGDPDEERMHAMYHDSSKPVIKHLGWKWERVAATFPDGRVVRVCPSDPKPWWSKVEAVLEKANEDLGISFSSQLSKHAHAYFYVSNMLIVGCLIAEPIRVAYRMLESDRKELERLKEPGEEFGMEAPSFCSNTPVRGSRCGINRIWVCASERRKGIASKMLDAVRATFVYGHILKLNEIAFSDPTPLGMSFAVKYTKMSNFLVYKITKD